MTNADLQVKIWTSAVADGSRWAAAGTIKLTVASTAVAMINDGSDGYLLAVGKESGSIEVFTVAVNRDGVKSDLLSTFDRR